MGIREDNLAVLLTTAVLVCLLCLPAAAQEQMPPMTLAPPAVPAYQPLADPFGDALRADPPPGPMFVPNPPPLAPAPAPAGAEVDPDAPRDARSGAFQKIIFSETYSRGWAAAASA